MKKLATLTVFYSLFFAAAFGEDISVGASNLTSGVNYLGGNPDTPSLNYIVDGKTSEGAQTALQRIYAGTGAFTEGPYSFGDVSVSVGNVKVTDRLSLFKVEGGASAQVGKVVYNVDNTVNTSTFYLGGQVWNTGTSYTVESIDATFNGKNTNHATSGVMTGGQSSIVNITNGITFNMTDANASVRWMYAGGYNQNSSQTTIKNGVHANISAGSISSTFIGGVYNFNGASSRIEGGTHINVTGGSHGDIFGGDQLDEGSSSFIDSTEVSIEGGSVNFVFGGTSLYTKSGSSSQIGTKGSLAAAVKINVGENAQVNTVIGGSYNSGGDNTAVVNGNVEIAVEGKVFDTVVGGGYGEGVKTNGNVFMDIRKNAQVGDVLGGGTNGSSLKGDITIRVSDNANISGTIYGAGEGSLVDGSAKLLIDSFNGSALKADSFDSVKISSDSIVEISLANVSTLSVENGAKVVLASGSAFEKLLVSFDDEIFELGGTVDISEIFGDSTSVVMSEIESGSSFVVLDAKQNLFTVGLNGSTLSITSEIPEPSTYAAILGAIALAFAAYRRRK